MKKILLSLVVFSFLTVFSTNQAQAKPVMLTGSLGCVFVAVLIDIEVNDNGSYSYEVLDFEVGSNCKGTVKTQYQQSSLEIHQQFWDGKISKSEFKDLINSLDYTEELEKKKKMKDQFLKIKSQKKSKAK